MDLMKRRAELVQRINELTTELIECRGGLKQIEEQLAEPPAAPNRAARRRAAKVEAPRAGNGAATSP